MARQLASDGPRASAVGDNDARAARAWTAPAARLLSERDRQALVQLESAEHPIIHSFPHGAVIVFDHDLRYLSAGGLGLRDVGLSREMLEGKTIYEAFSVETVAVIEPLYRAALAGQSTVFDVPYAGRLFSQQLSPVWGDSGVLAAMGFTQDVTENRLAERRLRESEQRFRLAFEHAPIGKAIVGLDGLFREVNPALCALTGYPPDELRALTFQDITHPDDLDADLTHLAQLITGDIDSYMMEKRYFTCDGALVWVLLTVTLVVDDDGEPLYYVAQMQDITQRKASEQALAQAHAAAAVALEHAAAHDELTGLPNRRQIRQRLTELLETPGRRNQDERIAVLFCDLDRFKRVNDELGHQAGDSVLRETAARLRTSARTTDTIGRLGGDEFVVLISGPVGEDLRTLAEPVAERICSAMSVPFTIDGRPMSVTVSIGIAFADRVTDADELLRRADTAMYAAKRDGRNGIALYGDADPHGECSGSGT